MDLKEFILLITEKNDWKNESRIVGEACEEYVKTNIKCLRCNNNNFRKCQINEKSKDLICIDCDKKYQIKAKRVTQRQNNTITSTNKFKTIGGEYLTTLNSIEQNIDYLIILYEKETYNILNILYIKSENVNTECIVPRKKLSLAAKRAGWQGCNILFNNFETIKNLIY
jgi:type II restriction enzyme